MPPHSNVLWRTVTRAGCGLMPERPVALADGSVDRADPAEESVCGRDDRLDGVGDLAGMVLGNEVLAAGDLGELAAQVGGQLRVVPGELDRYLYGAAAKQHNDRHEAA